MRLHALENTSRVWRGHDRGTPRIQLAASLAIIAAVWLVAETRWIAKDAVVPWDSKNQFYAFFRFLSATIHAGNWPFWNPFHYGGHPSVADPQSLVLSPVFLIWAALDRGPTMRAFDLVVFAHLLAGGLAIAVLGWRMRWPMPSCVLAAALYMFGGAASGRLQHTGIIITYGIFPIALLLLQLALERRSYLISIGFALAAASIAMGRNQVALLFCFLMLAKAAAVVLSAARPERFLRERLGVLITMAAVSTAVLIVPLLLTLQFAELSNRPSEALGDALRGSLYPANFATLAIANIFGTHGSYWGPGASTLPEVALTDDSENYLFFGTVPVLLLLWFGVAGTRAWRRHRRLMTATVAIVCLFMLGRYAPLYPFAFKFVPGIDLFRRPTDASFLLGITFAILCGHCLADYVHAGPPPLRLLPAVAAASAWLGVVASAIEFSARTGHVLDAAREVVETSAIMIIVCCIMLVARRPPTRFAAAGLVTVIAIGELLWWNAASRLNAESRSLYAVLEQPTGKAARAITLLEAALAVDHRRGDYPRVEVLGLGGPWQNLAVVRGWDSTNGYNPLRIGSYDRLVDPGEENWNISHRRFPPSFDSYISPLAKALGLTYLVLGQPLNQLPGQATPPAADLLLLGPPIWIYRLSGALPRAVIEPGADFPNGFPLEHPGDSLPEDAQALPQSSASPTSDNRNDVEIISSKPGRVEVIANLAKRGRLVLHDTYYPGWIAEIDGKSAPILRADRLFRAVELASGTHRVVFRFSPFSLTNIGAIARTGIQAASRYLRLDESREALLSDSKTLPRVGRVLTSSPKNAP